MTEYLERLTGSDRASVPQVIGARVQQTPDRVFLQFEGRTWTYAQSWDEARLLGGFLSHIGQAGPDRRVASFLPNVPEALWAWWGTQLTGAAYVPVNRAHRGPILADMLARSGAEVLITDSAALEDLPPSSKTQIRTVLVTDAAEADEVEGYEVVPYTEVRRVEGARPLPVPPAHAAAVLYTSGTTGRSKAVVLPHNQFCRGAAHVAASVGIVSSDVFHAWLPLVHVAGQLDMTLPVVLAGASISLYPTFSRSRFWSQVEESGATLFIGFANVVEILWAMPECAEDHDTTLRAGIIGHIPPKLHHRFEKRFGVRLYDVYGMTEAEPIALPPPGVNPPVGSCGRPNPDFEVAILDSDDQRLPPGNVGEIAVRPMMPDVMMKGYEGDDAATLAATRNLWFHTGDLGYRDDEGLVFFVDRRKDVIRRRGENISSWELESIVRDHPNVDDCAAVGVPSPLGDEDVKVVVVPVEGETLDPAELHAFCEERVAGFMVPRYVEIRAEMPQTPTGKVRKELLKEMGAEAWDAEAGERVGRVHQK